MSTDELNFDGKEAKKFFTHDAKAAILAKYIDKGQHLVLFEVQDSVGTSGQQYCDAVVIGNWASTGREVWGMEIKASRSDWLRELKKPDKSDRFTSQCDRWFLVTTERSIVKDNELPAEWGWLNMTPSGGLRVEKQAPKLPHASEPALRRGWAYALMRRAYEKNDEDVERRVRLMREELLEAHRKQMDYAVKQARVKDNGPFEALQKRVQKFEAASGINLEDWEFSNAGDFCKLMRKAMPYGGMETLLSNLETHGESIDALRKGLKLLAMGV